LIPSEILNLQLAILEDRRGKIVWASRETWKTGFLGKEVVGRSITELVGAAVARDLARGSPAYTTIDGKVYLVQRAIIQRYVWRVFTRVA
jgi:hypothetical protein